MTLTGPPTEPALPLAYEPSLDSVTPSLFQAHREIGREVDRPFGCRLDSLKATFPLLQIDGLIVAARIELRAPYFVHSLVLGPTVVNRRPKSQIQVPQPFQ